MNKTIIMSLSLAALLLLVGCTTSIPLEKQCQVDTDCVQAQCCHATDAVAKQYAPNCTGSLCTLDCAPKTLDCSQGSIKCIDNQCIVVLNDG